MSHGSKRTHIGARALDEAIEVPFGQVREREATSTVTRPAFKSRGWYWGGNYGRSICGSPRRSRYQADLWHCLPSAITMEMAKGFTLFMMKAVMSGRGDEIIDLTRTNLWR
jgi:hypothetical protein